MSPTDRTLPAVIAGLAAAIAIAAATVDVFVPASFNPTPLSCAAVALCGLAGARRWIWPLAIALVVLGYAGALAPSPFARTIWLNRTIAAASTLVIAWFAQRWLTDREALRDSRLRLERHAAELEAGNAEIAAREEEIASQNEELQSQTEELERQSEELRIVNEDLATRERMLAQLLDLSRTLATELHGADVMTTICQALTDILSEVATASAILLRDGDRLTVRCHHGFGPDGPLDTALPFEQSFASEIVLELVVVERPFTQIIAHEDAVLGVDGRYHVVADLFPNARIRKVSSRL